MPQVLGMRWLLAKENLGYTLYEDRQIDRREDKSGKSSNYEICVSSSTLILYLMLQSSKKINEIISLETENLNCAESALAELIISEHNRTISSSHF